MRVVMARGGAAWGLGFLLGCNAGGFLCESDEACQQGSAQGSCQPSGYCSFPDDTCPSGQRYGEHAGGSLPNTCVEPGSVGEAGTTDEAASTGTTTSGPATPTTGPTTLDDDGPASTGPVEPPETSTSTDPSATSVADDDPGTTTSTAELVCWLDDFDDGVIDPVWCPFDAQGVAVDELRGHLRVQLLPEQWSMDGGSAFGGVSICEAFPLLGASAAVEVVAVPQVSPYTEAYIELGNEELRLGLGVIDGQLYAFVFEGMKYASFAWQPYVPDAQRWLRVLGTDEGLVAEHSHDGVAWVHVYTVQAGLGGVEGSATLGSWAEMVPLGPDEATFEGFEVCSLQ
jgi:hypothetical protein